MAKTLVIKGANFSTNKLTTVEFADIPCTGISFSESTYSITDYDSVEIEYTVTPNDTTDVVEWESSDESVATVLNGEITPVGLGTCTITATCGEHSATASVTVVIEYVLGSVFASYASTNGSITIAGDTNGRVCALGVGSQRAKYKAAVTSGISGDYYPVAVPKNTAYVRFSFKNSSNLKNNDYSAKVIWGKNEESTGIDNTIKYVGEETSYNVKTETTKSYAIPEGADVVAYKVQFANPSTYTSDELMEDAGFKMEFLTSLS